MSAHHGHSAYQADLLRDLDEGKGVSPDALRELRPATKEMTKSVSQSMVALVATERHLWLILPGTKDKDKSFLMDAPLAPPGPSPRGFRRQKIRRSRDISLSGLLGCWAGQAL